MRKISVRDLETLFKRIIRELDSRSIEEVELPTDLYREIPTDQWDRFDNVTIHNCSLFDDLDELEKLVRDETRVCTYVDFDRVASILRAISQVENPPAATAPRV